MQCWLFWDWRVTGNGRTRGMEEVQGMVVKAIFINNRLRNAQGYSRVSKQTSTRGKRRCESLDFTSCDSQRCKQQSVLPAERMAQRSPQRRPHTQGQGGGRSGSGGSAGRRTIKRRKKGNDERNPSSCIQDKCSGDDGDVSGPPMVSIIQRRDM